MEEIPSLVRTCTVCLYVGILRIGIILNHRQLFAGCEVSRSLMPSAYHIKNFNNGIIKGSIKINHRISKTPSDSILAYGYGGVWLTDAEMKTWKDFNKDYPRTWMARISATWYRQKRRNLVCSHDGCISLRWKGMEDVSARR